MAELAKSSDSHYAPSKAKSKATDSSKQPRAIAESAPTPSRRRQPTRERRSSPRVAVAIRCRCYGKERDWPGLVCEVSAGGLGVVSGYQPQTGEQVAVVCELGPEGQAFQFAGIVLYQSEMKAGLRFAAPPDKDRKRVLQYLGLSHEYLEPMYLGTGSGPAKGGELASLA